MIRDFSAKLVRHSQYRHSCVDIRVVLNHIAATVPMMEEDKDDSNDSQNGGDVYSTMTRSRNERAPGKGYSRHASDATHAQCGYVYRSRQ